MQVTNDGHNAFFLKTGEALPSNKVLIGGVLPQNFNGPNFPGDLAEDNSNWVIDSTISLDKIYPSEFFFLIFAAPMLKANYLEDPGQIELKKTIKNVFKQIKRFSDYWKDKKREDLRILVIGTGNLSQFNGFVDIFDLKYNFPEYTFISFEGYIGIYLDKIIKEKIRMEQLPLLELGSRKPKPHSKFSKKDEKLLETLKKNEDFENVKIIADLMEKNRPYSLEFTSFAPDIICRAKNGKYFQNSYATARKLYQIQSYNLTTGYTTYNDWLKEIPLKKITDVFNSIMINVQEGPTAVIIIEGVGPSDIPHCQGLIDTTWGDLPYGADHNFINAITTGKTAFETSFPYGFLPQLTKTDLYPYSWGMPPVSNALGSDSFPGTSHPHSIAVGSRSMFLHMYSGCDISLEPWVRNRTENGVFYVLNKNQIKRKS